MSETQFQTINPATGETLKTYHRTSPADVDKILEQSWLQFTHSKRTPVSVRAQHLLTLANEFRKSSEELALMITLEMGKPIKDSLAEIEKCALGCEYYGNNLEQFLNPEEVQANYEKSIVVKDPLGPILAIMPWNYPVWQAIRFAAPAVGIGNPILLKHSDHTAGTAEMIEKVFNSVSPGLLYNLRVDHDQAAQIIADKRISGVTLTGSARAGREVAQAAGKSLKKTVLELGGSDAYVVFRDCDLAHAAKVCAEARMINNGQSCISAKRFIVHKTIFDAFISEFQNHMIRLKHGDPLKKETRTGALAAKRFQSQMLEQCRALEETGAEKLFDLAEKDGFDFGGNNAFFPARIYHAKKDHPFAFEEEFFGPVSLVFDFDTDEEALELSNRSIYGLGGAVFSSDLPKAEKFAREMEAGFVAINEQVKSDPRLPFGGVKDSGYGRELSLYGFNEFCNIKTIGFGKKIGTKAGVE